MIVFYRDFDAAKICLHFTKPRTYSRVWHVCNKVAYHDEARLI